MPVCRAPARQQGPQARGVAVVINRVLRAEQNAFGSSSSSDDGSEAAYAVRPTPVLVAATSPTAPQRAGTASAGASIARMPVLQRPSMPAPAVDRAVAMPDRAMSGGITLKETKSKGFIKNIFSKLSSSGKLVPM